MSYFRRTKDISLSKLEVLADFFHMPLDYFRKGGTFKTTNVSGNNNSVSVGNVSGNCASLLIAIGPRVFLGWFSAILYRWMHNKTGNTALSACVSAGVNTLLHTLGVMGLIVLFFGKAYSAAVGIPVGSIIAVVIGSNGVWEILLAIIVIGALARALKPYLVEYGG